MKCFFILPTMLFQYNDILDTINDAYIIEHAVFFKMYNYNKLKLVMHRATMTFYKDYIKKKYKCNVYYINYDDDINNIFIKGYEEIHMYYPHDHHIMTDINELCKKHKIKLITHESKMFITSNKLLEEYYNINKNKQLLQTNFYKWQRKRLNILMENNEPTGGRWSYDKDNRQKFEDNIKEQYKKQNITNKYIIKAKQYIDKHFYNNYGTTEYYLPVTFNDAKKHLKEFINERLSLFGKYQDAVKDDILFGYHSLLSPLLNTGLLTPKYVIDKVLEKYKKEPKKNNIETIEGFIRQIIGWREYCNYTYIYYYKHDNIINQFNNNYKLDKNVWYKGTKTTGIEIIDKLINKVIKIGYLHHIERLMYIGNFMMIIKTDPREVFKWFQCMFIDSYHVFMYPNVYGMSQYASKYRITTRPYISSSNYIIRMSNNKKKCNKITIKKKEYYWNEIWDALYYNFIEDNKEILKRNYFFAGIISKINNTSLNKKKMRIELAKEFMKKI